MTLDFSKAYDLLDPAVTYHLLLHLGWEPNFVKVLHQVWRHQKRWVTFQSHTCAIPLQGPSLPQGDPLGPLVMTLWAWAGWLAVERSC